MFGNWNSLVVLYLFLAGTGAGAYLYSLCLEKRGIYSFKGYILAPVFACVGALLLIFDLSPDVWVRPWKLLPLLSNQTSVMTWGTYILLLFIIVAAVKAFVYMKGCCSCCRILNYGGALLAVATIGYTGVLLMAADAVPFWQSIFIPILFIFSSISCGAAAVRLMGVGTHSGVKNIIIGVELVVLFLFVLLALNGGQGIAGQVSASMLLSGSLWIMFWGLLVLLGLIVPLMLGILKRMPLLADVSTLIGGAALRFCIILAAIPVI